MAEYTIAEIILIRAKTIKHRVIAFIDKLMPHIFIRKSLFEYRPSEIHPMLVEEVLSALGATGPVRVVFQRHEQ